MDTETPPHQRFTVYFDGSCPLCIREIGYYKSRRGADAIEWRDVSNASFCETDLSCTEAMARFHVRSSDGELFQGGEAFAHLWTQLPGFRWIGRLFLLPGLKQALNLAYRLFLPVRPMIQRWFKKPFTSVSG